MTSFIIGLFAILMGVSAVLTGIGLIFIAPVLSDLYKTLNTQAVNPYISPIFSLILGILNIFLGIKILKKSDKRERSATFYLLFIVITVLSFIAIKSSLGLLYDIASQIK